MKDRPDDPSHLERTLLPRSYITLLEHLGPWDLDRGADEGACFTHPGCTGFVSGGGGGVVGRNLDRTIAYLECLCLVYMRGSEM